MDTADTISRAGKLEEYKKAFNSFKPKDPQALLPENSGVQQVEEQFSKWRSGAHDNSVALVGTPGSGSCITLEALQRKFSRNVTCTTVALDRYGIAHDGLPGALGAELGCGRSAGMDDLLKVLAEQDSQVIFLLGCHNLFIRRVGGFGTLYDLHHLLSFTRGKVLWVTQWSPYTWHYLDRTIGFASYFDMVIQFGRLPIDVLAQWVKLKHDATGFVVNFDGAAGEVFAEENKWLPAEHRIHLEKAASGNLDAACSVWLKRAELGEDNNVRMGLFPLFTPETVEILGEEDFYILGSLLIHREISLEDLAEDMNLSELATRMRLDHLANRGVVSHDRAANIYSIEPAALPTVVLALRKRNLFDVKEPNG